MAATRTNDVYLGAQYQRLRPGRGHERALGAVKHSILSACWHMLTTGEFYRDLCFLFEPCTSRPYRLEEAIARGRAASLQAGARRRFWCELESLDDTGGSERSD